MCLEFDYIYSLVSHELLFLFFSGVFFLLLSYTSGSFTVSFVLTLHFGAQYIKTIGQLEPSHVIRKFLDSQRIYNLTDYLQVKFGQLNME